MKYYFVDYENVHADGLTGYECLSEGDVVCILYSDADKSFSLEILEQITVRRTIVESFKAETGSKNALDFQLSSYLGYKIAKNESDFNSFYIVSKDKGYDRVVEFWSKRGITIKRILNLNIDNDATKTPATKKSNVKKKKEVSASTEEKNIANAKIDKAKTAKEDTVKTNTVKKDTANTNANEIKADNTKALSVDNDNKEQEAKAKPSKKRQTKKVLPNKEVASDERQLATKEEMLKYITEGEYSDELLSAFNSFKTKQAITRGMDKIYKDSKETSRIYKKLKPLVKAMGKT